jgi:CubicO group peptidase (beta-lactamase class C family)
MKYKNYITGLVATIAVLGISSCSTLSKITNKQKSPAQTQETTEAPAIPSPVAITAQTLRGERLDKVMTSLIDSGKVAGLSILVLEDGTESYYNAAGLRDRENKTPMSREAVGRYYSMTKPIVGVGLMMLLEDGKVALDDPIAKYLPEFTQVRVYAGQTDTGRPTTVSTNRPITIRDLMRHTSGFTYGFISQTPVDIMYLKGGLLSFDQTTREFSHKLAKLPLAAQPGEKFIYGMSTDVLGHLIEVVSGQSLGDYLDERIFTPLGMTHTGFKVKDADRDIFSPVYTVTEDGLARMFDGMPDLPFEIDAPFLKGKPFQSGGGGLVSTLDDYAKFTLMMRARGGDLISAQSYAQMTNDQMAGINKSWLGADTGFGLTMAIKTGDPLPDALPIPKGSYYWGGMAGTYFWIDPANDLIFIMQMQMISRAENDIRNRVAHAVYGTK